MSPPASGLTKHAILGKEFDPAKPEEYAKKFTVNNIV
jgi:hypothetical protein